MKRMMAMLAYRTLAAVTLTICMSVVAMAQTMDYPAWRWGVLGGLQGNFVGAGAQTLEGIGTEFTQPHNTTGVNDIIDGSALGFYFGAMTEYNPGGLLGGQLRVAYDDRRVHFNDWDVPDASQTRFSARMTYVSVEPLLRLNLVQPNFHITAGPLLSFKINSEYDYVPGRDETTPQIVGAEIPGANSFTYGVSGGFGYDIPLNPKGAQMQWFLTPFAEASYMMDQREASDRETADRNDVWVTTSVRGGFQLKFGAGPAAPVVVVPPAAPSVDVSLRAPNQVVDSRMMTEYFPLRNYLFFPAGQSAIPAKYVKLDPANAAAFDEETMLRTPVVGNASATDRSQRQMSVYYNALNIYGDRMRDNPGTTIELVGSAPDQATGLAMANNVKQYMVSTFGIDASRISTRGAVLPPHYSGTRATPAEDLDLIAEENVRVEVLSNNMEVLKPVKLSLSTSDIVDNDLVLNVRTAGPVADWTVQITGDGYDRTFGPYRSTTERIDSRQVLGERASGNYTATIVARTTDGRTITETESFSLVRNSEPPMTSTRYSILFEYDESKTVQTYDEFLRNTVAPNIPDNSTVVVHGHTDVAGLADYNYELSNRRANAALAVLKDATTKSGKTVRFDTYGFGEDVSRAPFSNDPPEGRYYNRTVMIEVIPATGTEADTRR